MKPELKNVKTPEAGGSHRHIQESEGVVQRKQTQLISVGPSDRRKSNGHTLKHRRLPLNIRKHFFFLFFSAVRVMETGNESTYRYSI